MGYMCIKSGYSLVYIRTRCTSATHLGYSRCRGGVHVHKTELHRGVHLMSAIMLVTSHGTALLATHLRRVLHPTRILAIAGVSMAAIATSEAAASTSIPR